MVASHQLLRMKSIATGFSHCRCHTSLPPFSELVSPGRSSSWTLCSGTIQTKRKWVHGKRLTREHLFKKCKFQITYKASKSDKVTKIQNTTANYMKSSIRDTKIDASYFSFLHHRAVCLALALSNLTFCSAIGLRLVILWALCRRVFFQWTVGAK